MSRITTQLRNSAALLAALLLSQAAAATSCQPVQTILESAEAVFSFIPMQGRLAPAENVAVFEADTYRIWRGRIAAQETVSVVLPRMLLLGDEYVVAADRNDLGQFVVGKCTPVVEAHDNEGWIIGNLGTGIAEHTPASFEPTEQTTAPR